MEITPEVTTFSVLVFGFLLGLRHATEADHLAAVSTIVSERKNLFASSIVGGLWGLGHTISLFLVALVVIFMKLKISPELETKLEAIVGGMLILLGLNVLRKLLQSKKIHVHEHDHGVRPHVHLHVHGEEKAEAPHHGFSPRSVIVGMVHGLAGSGALMFIILPLIPSPLIAMLYVLIFGIGSIGGMMAMSFLIGLPFHFTANRFEILNKGIRLLAGVFSLGLGSYIVYEKLIAA
ncbi:MAG: urease accessory protein [Acidobacteriota bacterium]